MSYFENVGFAGEPLYVARTGDDNPFDGVAAGSYASPTLVYWDADGDLDLVASRADINPHRAFVRNRRLDLDTPRP